MSLLRRYLELFQRNPALRRLLAGEFISGIGDWLYLVAILVVVYAESNSPVLLGVIGAARILPYVILSVPAGMAADRFDRRMVLLVTDVARGILMVGLALAVMADAPALVVIFLAILAACFSTFFNPAIAALLPTLVDESDLGPANGAWATLDNVAFIIGPAIAGILIAAGGLELAFLLNAATFAVVAVVLWRLPAPRRRVDAGTPGDGSGPAPGWRSLVRPMLGPIVLDSASSFVIGGVGVLTVVIAVDLLDVGESGTGFLQAATGVGGVVAGVAGGALLARRLRVPLLVGGAAGGIGLVGLALSDGLVGAMIAIGVAIGGLLLLDVVNTTLIQRMVPDELRGRAMGLLQTSSAIVYSLGSLLMPILGAVVGVPAVLVIAAAVVAVGVTASLVLVEVGPVARPVDPVRLRLLDQPIFAGLPPARLEAAARALVPTAVEPGESVVREGDPADRFYLVDSGRLRVSQTRDGAEVELRELGPGAVFGEIGLLRDVPRTATVMAVTPGVLYALDAAGFAELVGSGPGLGSRLLDLYRGALGR